MVPSNHFPLLTLLAKINFRLQEEKVIGPLKSVRAGFNCMILAGRKIALVFSSPVRRSAFNGEHHFGQIKQKIRFGLQCMLR